MSERRLFTTLPPVGRATTGRTASTPSPAQSSVAHAASSVANTVAHSSDNGYSQEESSSSRRGKNRRSKRDDNDSKGSGIVRRFFMTVWIVITILLVASTTVLWLKTNSTSPLAVDTSKYQAVFFTNGQVYFGKLSAFNGEYMKLTDVYYLQTQAGEGTDSENPQQTTTDESNVQLIKLGNEIHGPQDEMVISKSQVLFYENLKADSQVSKSIEQYKAGG